MRSKVAKLSDKEKEKILLEEIERIEVRKRLKKKRIIENGPYILSIIGVGFLIVGFFLPWLLGVTESISSSGIVTGVELKDNFAYFFLIGGVIVVLGIIGIKKKGNYLWFSLVGCCIILLMFKGTWSYVMAVTKLSEEINIGVGIYLSTIGIFVCSFGATWGFYRILK
jgi:hypothetical protein